MATLRFTSYEGQIPEPLVHNEVIFDPLKQRTVEIRRSQVIRGQDVCERIPGSKVDRKSR
ncbi:hypothetical protein [Sphingomonas sp. F9_3S_D5_B_2]